RTWARLRPASSAISAKVRPRHPRSAASAKAASMMRFFGSVFLTMSVPAWRGPMFENESILATQGENRRPRSRRELVPVALLPWHALKRSNVVFIPAALCDAEKRQIGESRQESAMVVRRDESYDTPLLTREEEVELAQRSVA